MANGTPTFDNDYSFLNLPGQGSAVRDPIDIAQDSLPENVIQSLNRTAPRNLLENNIFGEEPIVTPTRPQGILEDRNFRNTLETAVQNAEAEIQQLRQVKVDLTNNYQQAVAQQDTIRAEDAEQQLLAVETREQELLSERQQIVTELEDKFGVEREGLQGNISELESNIVGLQSSIDALTLERDDAVANQDVIRAEAANAQAQALEGQKTALETEYGQKITNLQGQLNTLSATPVVAKTDPVVVEETLPVVEETAPLKPQPDFYEPNYMGGVDEREIAKYYSDEKNQVYAPGVETSLGQNGNVVQPVQQTTVAPVTNPLGNLLGAQLQQPNYMVTNPERRSAIKDALKVFSDAGGWSQDEQTPEAQAKIQAAQDKLFSFNTQPIAQQAPVAPSNVGGKISPVYKKFQAQLNQGGEVNKIQLLLNRFR